MNEKVPGITNISENLTFKPYFADPSYVSMLAFINQGGDSNEILKIVEQVADAHGEWFDRDFLNRVGVWKENILAQGKLSEGGKEFIFKTLDDFWGIIYEGGKPRVNIHFHEKDEPNWQFPDEPRK